MKRASGFKASFDKYLILKRLKLTIMLLLIKNIPLPLVDAKIYRLSIDQIIDTSPDYYRPESRQAGQESTIYGAEDSKWQSSSQLPERLTPLMFSRPHVCARYD